MRGTVSTKGLPRVKPICIERLNGTDTDKGVSF